MIGIPAYVIEEAIDRYLKEVFGNELFWTIEEFNSDAIKSRSIFTVYAEDAYGKEVTDESLF